MRSNRFYALALVAALLSGVAALTHELLWTRRLIDLLGATHEASARVVACFFLGLSLGSALIAWVSERVVRPWRVAAIVELLVAVACLPVLYLPELYAEVWQRLGPAQLISGHGRLLKFGLSAAVVVPPAFCMGLTIPLMVAGVARAGNHSRSLGIWLYAWNTAGGVLGILIATECWLWWFGARGTILAAIALNAVVAVICFVLDRHDSLSTARPASQTPKTRADEPPGQRNRDPLEHREGVTAGLWLGVVLAFISGVGVLATEVLCIHLFAHVLSTLNATAAVLVAFISMLFLSSLAYPIMTPRYLSARQLVAPVMCCAALAICLLPMLFMVVTDDLRRSYDGFGSSLLLVATVMASVMATAGAAVFAAGLVFPLAMSHFPADSQRMLRFWGAALAVNGLGGALGAMLASHVLMSRVGLYSGFGVVALMYAMVPLGGAAIDRRSRSWIRVSSTVAVMVLVWVMMATILPALPVVSEQQTARIVAVEPGPDGVITVIERAFQLPSGPQISRSLVWDSQYTLGGTLSRYDEQRQAVLPIIMHPHPRSVAFLGLATGITAGIALDLPGVERVTVIELSPQVMRCARDYFAEFNRDICRDSRATVIVEDARTYVAACTSQFDVVVADLFRPYATGEGRLFTVEHFRAAKKSLRAGGLYAHWLPCHQLDQAEFEVALASFLEVFDEAELWRVNLKSQFTAIGLFGFNDGRLSFAGLEEKCRQVREQGRILDPPSRHPESIAMHYVGLIKRGDVTAPSLNTLENMWLELHCGLRHCLRDGFATSLTNAKWPPFEEELYRRVNRNPDAAGVLAPWRAVGRKVSRWYHAESRASRDEAELQRLRTDAQRSLPRALIEDAEADWTFWPLF